jgi:membrane-associated phospholipid phosphatase
VPRFCSIALLLLLAGSSLRASEDALEASLAVDGSITAAAIVTWGTSELAKGVLVPPTCRWCGTDALDANVRNALLWSNTAAAATASDLLEFGVPIGVAGYDLLAATDATSAAKDLLIVAEAVSLTGVVTQATRYAAARIRPYAYYGGRDAGRDDHLSFWSAHTVTAFSAAAAGGAVAQLRHYDGWPWVYAVGFGGAAFTGYFRMASDMHWLTDVLASAAVGTGVGLLVPWLHRAGGPTGRGLLLLPMPGGFIVQGGF